MKNKYNSPFRPVDSNGKPMVYRNNRFESEDLHEYVYNGELIKYDPKEFEAIEREPNFESIDIDIPQKSAREDNFMSRPIPGLHPITDSEINAINSIVNNPTEETECIDSDIEQFCESFTDNEDEEDEDVYFDDNKPQNNNELDLLDIIAALEDDC